jgi:hypothetical protein
LVFEFLEIIQLATSSNSSAIAISYSIHLVFSVSSVFKNPALIASNSVHSPFPLRSRTVPVPQSWHLSANSQTITTFLLRLITESFSTPLHSWTVSNYIFRLWDLCKDRRENIFRLYCVTPTSTHVLFCNERPSSINGRCLHSCFIVPSLAATVIHLSIHSSIHPSNHPCIIYVNAVWTSKRCKNKSLKFLLLMLSDITSRHLLYIATVFV